MGLPDYEPPWLRALPGAHMWCPTCGVLNDLTLRGLVLALPEGLQFWRAHPRIRTLPEPAIEVAGREAIITSFHSMAVRAGLDVVSARDSFAVMGVYETAGCEGVKPACDASSAPACGATPTAMTCSRSRTVSAKRAYHRSAAPPVT
jgi:hypothetical protein